MYKITNMIILFILVFIMISFLGFNIPLNKIENVIEPYNYPNNCLFDASIDYINSKSLGIYKYSSQYLRNECNKILKEEGLPIIPNGKPAGEQYLQALSKYFNMQILVKFDGYSYTIRHGNLYNKCDVDTIKLRHIGSQMNGHWIADD